MNQVGYSKEASNVNVPLITNIKNSVNEESFNQKLHTALEKVISTE